MGSACAEEEAALPQPQRKKRLVVLGSGWAAVSFLKSMKADPTVELTVISPRGYFLYSPLLPAAASGTIETRSIVEPLRQFLPPGATFLEAEALAMDPGARSILCKSKLYGDSFKVPYDTAVLAVGSWNTTFGTPGVRENALFLKSAEDVLRLRTRVHDSIEAACLPFVPEEERKRLLSIVICGGGPTGTELAAELQDLVSEDLARLYPSLRGQITITLIDSNCHVLSMFDRDIAAYTTAKFRKDGVNLVLEARVKEVTPKGVVVAHKRDGREEIIPFGVCVWATGIALHPLAASLAAQLPEHQRNTRSLVTDSTLCVKGAPARSIFAMGDAATVEQSKALDHAEELFIEFDVDKSGHLSVAELKHLLEKASLRYPQLKEVMRMVPPPPQGGTGVRAAPTVAMHFLAAQAGGEGEGSHIRALFSKYDANGDGQLDMAEFKQLLRDFDGLCRSYPATAQVAKQEGEYLAAAFNAGALLDEARGRGYPEFAWHNKGSLAFIGGGEAVASLPGMGIFKGWETGMLWKGFETSSQQSVKGRTSVLIDQFRSSVFGRDISTGGMGSAFRAKQGAAAEQQKR